MGGNQSRSGRGGEEKNFQPLPGLEPSIIQSEAQRYTTEISRLYYTQITLYYEVTLLLDLLCTLTLTHSMVQDILRKADSHSACQTISRFLYGIRRFITVLRTACHWTLL
jgi:hypothetical protein